LSAVAFWWTMLAPASRARLGEAGALLVLTVEGTAMAALGSLLTFSPVPWYPSYGALEAAHGIDPLADQQAAGLIMWIPIGTVFLWVGSVWFLRWIRQDEGALTPARRHP
jgi:cytochrome c oxidase assembly factor CtaG